MNSSLCLMLFLSLQAFASEPSGTVSFGVQNTGETKVKLKLEEFQAEINYEKNSPKIEITAKLIENSLQWVRLKDLLLLPRALSKIEIKSNAEDLYLKYENRTLHLQTNEGIAYTEFYYSLYQANKIEVFSKNVKIGDIQYKLDSMKSKVPAESRAHIDYSCNNSQIQFSKMEGEFYSVHCKIIRVGSIGAETPMLELSWIALNYNMSEPVVSIFRDSNPVKVTLHSVDHYEKVIEISASISKRLNRMKFAGGLGPYIFDAKLNAESKTEIAPSFMLYGNFTLGDTTSIRGFEALVTQNPTTKAYFNNFGIYFAYDLASLLDSRVQLMALLGGQGLTFAYHGTSGSTFSQAIFPQGFELTYFNAFGIRRNVFGFGMFILPSSNNPYNNMWIRYGKKIFWELNYISWELNQRKASMFGVSVGFPLAGFF